MLDRDHNIGFIGHEHGKRQHRIVNLMEQQMRALFVGGTVDNTEIEIDGQEPPLHYPPDTGSGQARYRLHLVGKQDDAVVYGVYGAPDLLDEEVRRVAEERDYARRFAARPEAFAA